MLHGVLNSNYKLCDFYCQWAHQGEIEKPSDQYLGLICDDSLTCHGLNSNPGRFGGSTTFILILCGESCLLVSWCAGGRCGMAGSNKDRGRSRKPGADDRGWSGTGWILGGRTIERSGDAVCSLHHALGDEECGFLGSTSKPRSMVCQWFGLKTTGTVCQWFGLKTTRTISPDLASKSVAIVSPSLPSKLVALGFPVWASKLMAMIW
jgi:hypothetical protein